MRTRISSEGQFVLPAEFRNADDIVSGQEFDIEGIGLVRREPPQINARFIAASALPQGLTVVTGNVFDPFDVVR